MTYKRLHNFGKLLLLISFISLFAVSCSKDDNPKPEPEEEELPLEYNATTDNIILKHEFRAAWLTTVGNYDWPVKGASAEAQTASLISIIDQLKSLNFNVILFHVRPTSDAFYHSNLVPWSYYLTGTQGADPGFDPLEVAIEEAHKRGMEVHAWLNPYRIGSTSITLASNHPAVLHPEWAILYNGNRYLNPGLPAVKSHLRAVVTEIVQNYDVDGIHFDDYFYPSGAKSSTNPFGFDDQATYNTYGGSQTVDAWREANVDEMVQDIGNAVKTLKPKVLYGISPQGKQENSMTVYADAQSWLQQKWVDYLAPQIYWQIGHATADFSTVLSYWNSNANTIPIIPGLAAYKYGDPTYPAYTLNELLNEVNMGRSYASVYGNCWFRVVHIFNGPLSSYIRGTIYPYKSLIPKMGSDTSTPVPSAPVVSLNTKTLTWSAVNNATSYAVYELERNGKTKKWNANCKQIGTGLTYQGNSGKNYFVIAVNGREKSPNSNIIYIP